jgi:hypothetical protein
MSSGRFPSLPFATPLYQEASLAQKGLLLDQVVTLTGYARKYAIGLLNQAPQGRRAILRPRLPCYGSEVRHALVLAWEAFRTHIVSSAFPFPGGCSGFCFATLVVYCPTRSDLLGDVSLAATRQMHFPMVCGQRCVIPTWAHPCRNFPSCQAVRGTVSRVARYARRASPTALVWAGTLEPSPKALPRASRGVCGEAVDLTHDRGHHFLKEVLDQVVFLSHPVE